MRITFLGHSGFFAELPDTDLLFDYYVGTLPDPKPEKPLFVFVSHGHPDHFSQKIFSLAEKTENILYLISDDIQERKIPGELRNTEKVRFLGPDQDVRVRIGGGPELRVRTFRSTDEGVAFLTDTIGEDGRCRERLYHAGDLNDWHWDDWDTEWNDMQRRNYQDALRKIASCVAEDAHIPDAAFVPVDTRLGEGRFFWMGLDEYMTAVGAGVVFPMHLFGDPGVIDRMRALPCAEGYRDRILGTGTPGERSSI